VEIGTTEFQERFYEMLKVTALHCLMLMACSVFAAQTAFGQALTAEQIVEKNIAARGGLEAWRNVKSMKMIGKMDAGGKASVQLPFVLELRRPRQSRLEIEFAGSKAIQVYDGTRGWKVRPFLGRVQVEDFTQAEMQTAAEQGELDGLLIDHETKGIKVGLEGKDTVEEKDTYKLNLTLPNGQTRYLWVDAKSFLEVKIEGFPRRLNGKMHRVETYYRDYQPVDGLMVPFVLETKAEKVTQTRKIVVEKVDLNPQLEDTAFVRPDVSGIKPVGAPPRSTAGMPQAR
jgi:hypothetical protein